MFDENIVDGMYVVLGQHFLFSMSVSNAALSNPDSWCLYACWPGFSNRSPTRSPVSEAINRMLQSRQCDERGWRGLV